MLCSIGQFGKPSIEDIALGRVMLVPEPDLVKHVRVKRGFWERLFSTRPLHRFRIVVQPRQDVLKRIHHALGPQYICHPATMMGLLKAAELYKARLEIGRHLDRLLKKRNRKMLGAKPGRAA